MNTVRYLVGLTLVQGSMLCKTKFYELVYDRVDILGISVSMNVKQQSLFVHHINPLFCVYFVT